jgi:7-cyano-7-deazaguanine synthase
MLELFNQIGYNLYMKRCVIPVSGGIDSSTILYYVKEQRKEFDEIYTLTFDYGQRHKKEINAAIDITLGVATSHRVVNIDFIKQLYTTSSLTNDDIAVAKTRDILGDPQTVNYVPNRNTIMLSICTGYAESVQADTVFHGAAQVDSEAGYWDGTVEFMDNINKLNSLNRRDRVTIEAPLIDKSKEEIIQLGLECGVDYSQTWTCYQGEDAACGKCPACSSRIKGFIDNKKIDPVEYGIDIPWDKYECEALT